MRALKMSNNPIKLKTFFTELARPKVLKENYAEFTLVSLFFDSVKISVFQI